MITLQSAAPAGGERVLTRSALAFVGELVDEFRPRVEALLTRCQDPTPIERPPAQTGRATELLRRHVD